jgi:hypothetical protein
MLKFLTALFVSFASAAPMACAYAEARAYL